MNNYEIYLFIHYSLFIYSVTNLLIDLFIGVLYETLCYFKFCNDFGW